MWCSVGCWRVGTVSGRSVALQRAGEVKSDSLWSADRPSGQLRNAGVSSEYLIFTHLNSDLRMTKTGVLSMDDIELLNCTQLFCQSYMSKDVELQVSTLRIHISWN
jgi:hypothetical protein